MVTGIVLLAVNLRPAAVSVGPVLDELIAELHFTGAEAGLLTSLPVLTFAAFGALTPRLAHVLGEHRLALLAMIAAVAGLVTRSVVTDRWLFLVLSLALLSGLATANVLLPSLVKRHFPERIELMTAVYSTTLALGVTGASVLTVPLAEAFGGWRFGLAAWAVLAGLAVLPWIGLVQSDRPDDDADAPDGPVWLAAVARTRLGWTMAVFFGVQSFQAYVVFGWFPALFRSVGYTAAEAGLLQGLVTGIGIPLAFAVPALTARLRSPVPLLLVLIACYVAGFAGLLVAPAPLAPLWGALVGIGTSTFPMILTLIGLRARTAGGTAALSGFTQSVGYLIAALGPFSFGLLHDLTDGWTVPLLVLLALNVPLLWTGVLACRPAAIEDELERLEQPVR